MTTAIKQRFTEPSYLRYPTYHCVGLWCDERWSTDEFLWLQFILYVCLCLRLSVTHCPHESFHSDIYFFPLRDRLSPKTDVGTWLCMLGWVGSTSGINNSTKTFTRERHIAHPWHVFYWTASSNRSKTYLLGCSLRTRNVSTFPNAVTDSHLEKIRLPRAWENKNSPSITHCQTPPHWAQWLHPDIFKVDVQYWNWKLKTSKCCMCCMCKQISHSWIGFWTMPIVAIQRMKVMDVRPATLQGRAY